MTHSPDLRFYGRRRGRTLSAVQEQLVTNFLQRYTLCPPHISLPSDQPVIFEIGFGLGHHLADQARQNPNTLYLGAEAFYNGIASLAGLSQAHNLTNLRVFPDDVRLLIPHLSSHSLDAIYVLFPDPWPKKRHGKRRLLNTDFLTQLAERLKPKGLLRLATDHADYLAWILEAAQACPLLRPLFSPDALPMTPYPGTCRSKYEQRALRAGRVCTYLTYARL
jgi:tRNA (guanine-N7-)-methyltransferase